jgi:hypothetical protein
MKIFMAGFYRASKNMGDGFRHATKHFMARVNPGWAPINTAAFMRRPAPARSPAMRRRGGGSLGLISVIGRGEFYHEGREGHGKNSNFFVKSPPPCFP